MHRFAVQKKSFFNSALLLQRRAVQFASSRPVRELICVFLPPPLAYPLQKKHHPLLQGNLEVLF